MALALFWTVIFETMVPSVDRLVRQASWWPSAVPQVKSFMYGFGFPRSPAKDFENGTTDDMASETYAWLMVTCVQHIASCLLILPVLCLGWERSGDAARFAFFVGTLSDVGWDLYDAVKRILTLPAMRRAFPVLLRVSTMACPEAFCLVLVGLHHTLALCLILPMNIYYPHLESYHRVCVALLGAAGVCYLLMLYKFSVNASSHTGLRACKIISVAQFLVLGFTRGLVWFPQAFSVLKHFHSQGDLSFLAAGCVTGLLMSSFNLIMLVDAVKAVAKWLPKTLPSVATIVEESLKVAATELAAGVFAEQANASAHASVRDSVRHRRDAACRARPCR